MRNPAHCLVLLCAWAPLAAEPASSQLLQGEVTGSEGSLIPSALVALLDADEVAVANDLTASDGVYRLEVPEPGSYLIRAEAPGWAPYRSGTFERCGAETGYE